MGGKTLIILIIYNEQLNHCVFNIETLQWAFESNNKNEKSNRMFNSHNVN